MHLYVYDCVIHWDVHVGYSGSLCCAHNFGIMGFRNIAMEPLDWVYNMVDVFH